MAEGYVKILSSILDSSIWAEPDDTVRVWVTMLAMADRNGYVGAAPSGIAHRSRTVGVERVRELLEKFQQPDPESRTEDHEGRRIEKVDRGFLILNYKKIRDMHGEEASKASKRKWWNANRNEPKLEPLEQVSSSEISSNGSVVVVANGSGSDLVSDARSKPKRSAAKKPVAVECPEFLQPTEATIAVGVATGRSWVSDFAAMRDWAIAKGERKVSWEAALRNWMRRAAEQSPRAQGGNVGRQVKPPQPNAEDDRDRYVARRLGETDDDLARRTADIRSGKRGLYD